MVSNLSRLNEEEETDRQGVFHILGVFENLVTFMPPLAEQLATTTVVLSWLLDRLKHTAFDSNKQYASEILAILLQRPANAEKALGLDAVESLLMVLSVSCHLTALTLLAISQSRAQRWRGARVHGKYR